MQRTLLIALLTLAVALGAGCGIAPPKKLSELPQAAKLRQSETGPLRYLVALAPVQLVQKTKPKAQHAVAVKPDPVSLRNELAETLRTFEIFQNLTTIDAPGEPEALQLAKEQGADLLLSVKVVRYDVAYDHGVRGTGNFILWLMCPMATWWVADEVYSADIALQLMLTKISDGSVLWQQDFAAKESCELDDMQRGFKFYGIFSVPGSLHEGNFQKVAEVVGPHAMQKVQLEILEELRKLPQPPPEKKTFALVVGTNECNVSALPKLKFAQADAASVAQLLEESFSEVKILAGPQATLEAFRAAVEDFGTREHIDIMNLLVYFAGPGATGGGKHWLAFSDSTDKASMLSLEQLHSMLKALSAKKRVIILDSGFTAGKGSRGGVLDGKPVSAFEDSLLKSTAVATLCSCGPGQGGHEFDSISHGVFTAQLVPALKGPADIDGDGAITAEEAITYLQWSVERYVRDNTVGESQKPSLLCRQKTAETIILKAGQ